MPDQYHQHHDQLVPDDPTVLFDTDHDDRPKVPQLTAPTSHEETR